MQTVRAPLSNARWHFQHGPIDLVIGAEGDAGAVAAAHQAAWVRFSTVLAELVAELPALRSPVQHVELRSPVQGGCQAPCPVRGVVARRMWTACRPFAAGFITPMAAVAGSVADELIACYDRPVVTRAWVNNGGDIALHLTPGASVQVGLVSDLARVVSGKDVHPDGAFTVAHALPVRGVATSGWRGRSFSLGIADSVTVLARTGAMADAAATVIANAVDVDAPGIQRRPACSLKDDSDLGVTPVTVDVARLPGPAVAQALARGAERARALQAAGLIHAALLVCQGAAVRVDAVAGPGRVPPRRAGGAVHLVPPRRTADASQPEAAWLPDDATHQQVPWRAADATRAVHA